MTRSPRSIQCPRESCRALPGDPCRNNQGDLVQAHAERVEASPERVPHHRKLEARIRVLEEQVRSLQMVAPRGIPSAQHKSVERKESNGE